MPRTLRLATALAASVVASAAFAADPNGFYGGIALRDNGAEQGISVGATGNVGRFTPSLTDGRQSQALVFGGYRWDNDVSVEASLASVDSYRLTGRGGVGLTLGDLGTASRAWNLDVYGNWSFWRRFSLFGRLGYSQSDVMPLYSTSIASAIDRRTRDGLSYGVGLRYDLNRAFGLRLEYARVGTGNDAGALQLPDGDQVQFGLQYRF
jgi:opacity protein-like surface antigen